MGDLARQSGAQPYATLDTAYACKPHAALICVPTSLHLPLARQAWAHGCHVFVEKPLSHTLAGVGEFLDEVGSGGRVLLVGYNLRFDPMVQRLKDWVDGSAVGHPVSARLHFGSHLPSRHPWEDYRVGYGARRDLGGGVILDAIHEIDYALWLFGMPTGVSCTAGTFSDLEIDVEDVAEIALSYPGCVVSIHLDYVQQPHRRWCEIIGTKGFVTGDLVGRTLALHRDPEGLPEVYEPECSADEVYAREMAHFLDCIDGRSAPAVDGAVAMQSLLVADAAKQSAESGRRIRVAAATARGGA